MLIYFVLKKNVAVKNQISLSKQIKTVKAKKCPSGFIKLIDTEDLKGAKGEQGPRGEKGETGAQGSQGPQGAKGDSFFEDGHLPYDTTISGLVTVAGTDNTLVSFPSNVKNGFEIGGDEECTGSVANPTATPGYLCIYNIAGTVNASRILYNVSTDECTQEGYSHGEHCVSLNLNSIASNYISGEGYNSKNDCEALDTSIAQPNCDGCPTICEKNAHLSQSESNSMGEGYSWIGADQKCIYSTEINSLSDYYDCMAPNGLWWGYCIDDNTSKEVAKYVNNGFIANNSDPKIKTSYAIWVLHTDAPISRN